MKCIRREVGKLGCLIALPSLPYSLTRCQPYYTRSMSEFPMELSARTNLYGKHSLAPKAHPCSGPPLAKYAPGRFLASGRQPSLVLCLWVLSVVPPMSTGTSYVPLPPALTAKRSQFETTTSLLIFVPNSCDWRGQFLFNQQ